MTALIVLPGAEDFGLEVGLRQNRGTIGAGGAESGREDQNTGQNDVLSHIFFF